MLLINYKYELYDKNGKMSGIANRILRLLKEKPRQTPQSVAGQLSVSTSTVKNTLVVLSDLKLVETKVRGLYEISLLGERLLKEIS